MGVRKIQLQGKYGDGKFALVSEQDYQSLFNYRWNVSPSGYAIRSINKDGKPGGILMHREIMDPPPNLVIDHINRNPLDNRRENLRIVTQKENIYNSAHDRNNTSQFKGVSWDRNKNMWHVRVALKGEVVFQEYHRDIELAARVYDYFALKAFGEFAYLNFPDNLLTNYKKRTLMINNTSGYLGVSWSKDKRKWHAYIQGPDGRRINIGRFADKHEAARKYNEKAIELYGDSARINIINEEGATNGGI